MSITVKLFASLREELDCDEFEVNFQKGTTISEVFVYYFNRPPVGIRFAQNQLYVSGNTILSDGDEIAFLPPLGGG
jgi:molybdopterin converting factor small subunit